MDRALPPPRPQQQEQEQEQPMFLTELLEQLIADVADTNANKENDNDKENGNDSSLLNTVDDRQRRRLVVIESLLRKELFPLRQRIKINDLIDAYHTNLTDDVHDMITDQRTGEQYEGLDSDRDTIEEVTSIVRLIPEVLQKRKPTRWAWGENDEEDESDEDEINAGEWVDVDDDDDGDYPIQCLSFLRGNEGDAFINLKAVPFIHLFAQLALEYDSFDESKRGGLLIPGEYNFNNIMLNLVNNNFLKTYSEDDFHRADEVRTNELLRLRQMNLLTVDDVGEYRLFSMLCIRDYRFFPHNSIGFFIEWSPTLLLQPTPSILIGSEGFTLIYSAVSKMHSILNFRFIFEYMIRYFPYKEGITLLFRGRRRDGVDFTAFNMACKQFDRPQVMEVVEDVLAQVSGTTPINTVEAIVLAATDPDIQLDCLYFLIQRRPDILLRSSNSSSTEVVVPSTRSTVNASVVHEDDDDDDDDNDNSNDSDNDIEGDGNDDCEGNDHTKKPNRRVNDDDHTDTDITTARNLKRNRSK